jgi:hypothetical protein
VVAPKAGVRPRGERGPVTLYWHDGGKKPPADLTGGGEPALNGAIVVGTQGTLSSKEWTGGDWSLLPKKRFRDYDPPKPSPPRAPRGSHHQEWLRACKGGPPAFCRFDGFAAELTEAMLVAALALRTGKKILWDAEKMEARGCPEAKSSIKRQARTGW